MALKFERLTLQNLNLLDKFLNNLGEGRQSFRYFDKRPQSIIAQHFVTWLLMDDNEPVAYGHLEEEAGLLWLGIAVVSGKEGQGLGKKMMSQLIADSKLTNHPFTTLTVDKDNLRAVALYEKFLFKRVSETEKLYKYQLNLKDVL